MNKQEMKELALSKKQDNLKAIIDTINSNIRKNAEKGLFSFTFDPTQVASYDFMHIVIQHFEKNGFFVEKFIKGEPITLGWYN